MTTPTDKSEVSSLEFDLLDMTCERDRLQSQLTDLRSQVEALHADGAVMRSGYVKIRAALCYVQEQELRGYVSYCGISKTKHIVDDAILQSKSAFESTSCGADLLARYREAVKLLEGTKGFDMHAADWKWMNRRDTLLATVKGGSQ